MVYICSISVGGACAVKSNVFHINYCNIQIDISGFGRIYFIIVDIIGVSNLSICELISLSHM